MITGNFIRSRKNNQFLSCANCKKWFKDWIRKYLPQTEIVAIIAEKYTYKNDSCICDKKQNAQMLIFLMDFLVER